MVLNIDQIVRFESGLLDFNETIDLFSDLIKSGIVWQLQGSYGRTAMDLIESGYLDSQGNVLMREG